MRRRAFLAGLAVSPACLLAPRAPQRDDFLLLIDAANKGWLISTGPDGAIRTEAVRPLTVPEGVTLRRREGA